MDVQKDVVFYIEVLLTRKGDPMPGLAVLYEIRRSSDEVVMESGNLVDVGTGVYKKAVVLHDAGQFRVQYDAPDGYDDSIESIMVSQAPGVSEIVEGVWNENMLSHNIVGTFGWFIQKLLTVAKFIGLK